ncbi:MAG TPA: hypothetical protein VGR62_08090 [Candidatus Binatia bacterium]|nr:hypothetical protein [Candidatus Binatia bacterium]
MNRLTVLRVLAVLVALRACMNLAKPFRPDAVLIFLGESIGGTTMHVLAPLLGLYMIVWAATLWRASAGAFWLGFPYLAFIVVNIGRFPIAVGLPAYASLPMYAVYGLVAIGVPAVALWLVASIRRESR